MRNRKNKNVYLLLIIGIVSILLALYYFNLIPHPRFTNAFFKIETIKSLNDQDNDGIDDQTDILAEARTYVATKPKYKSVYYAQGYPNDGYGTCTDVVGFALLNSGYDLMELVNQSIRSNPSAYNIPTVDKRIDFRRVNNLKTYFDLTAYSLTTDLDKRSEWQGGDIVVFPKHIAIVSDVRNWQGYPFIIHHGGQLFYEEDAITRYKIVGHYRIN